jgi:outer membrane receptor protein involved in Fe transport
VSGAAHHRACIALAAVALTGRAIAQDAEYGASARVHARGVIGTSSASHDTAVQMPGALGEPARALLDAPGAVRSGFLGSDLILWGAAPTETRVYLDGVELPYLYHPTGLRTTVHPALIRQVTVSPGALAADYGRSLGGAAEVDVVSLKPGGRVAFRADAIDGAASMSAGSARIRGMLAARFGYFDRVLRKLAPGGQDVLAVPAHQDGAARLELRPTPGTTVALTWVGALDAVALRPARGPQDRENGFHSASLKLDRRYDDGGRVRVVPFFGIESRTEASAFDGVPLALQRAVTSYGLRADYARTFDAWTARVGLDVRGARERIARSGTAHLPARESDVRVFGQAPVDAIDHDRYRVTTLNVAPWVMLTFRHRGLSVTPGLRLETYLMSTSRLLPAVSGVPAIGHDALTMRPEPRLAIGVEATHWLQLEARVGLHHQPPDGADLGATFGSPALGPARSRQLALGARLSLPFDSTLELVAFDKALRDLAVRTTDSPALVARELVATGRGKARGISVTVQRVLATDLFYTLSYTLSDSRRSGASGRMRPFDHDQRHVMSSTVGYRIGPLTASARARVATGAPRTAVMGSYLDTASGRFEPRFGRHNGARLPAYFSLDLHVEYGMLLDVARLALFADILNLTNRTNVEDFAFARDYQTRRDVRSFPIVAMLGVGLSLDHE